MLFNYLKIAVRNLLKYRFISFINLFGLTVGLTCCLLILTYILNELSYDRYHDQYKRIYRVTRSFNDPETGAIGLNLSTISPPFGPRLQSSFPEIEKMTRLLRNGNTPVRFGDKMFNETDVYWADENIFDFFKIKVLKGNAKKSLSDSYTILITDEIARKYFGNSDPINQLVRIDTGLTFRVGGVFKPFPNNTHLHPSILASFSTLNDTAVYGAENLATNWGNNSFFTYIMLPEKYNPQNMIARFPEFLNKNMTEGGTQYKTSQWTALDLQRLADIHLYSHMDYEAEENGDIKRVYVFSAIALFILLIACINYMNLSTARSALRAREIGVRKVVGARRREIIAQFLSESVLVSWIAMVLAFVLTWVALPWLNKISGTTLSVEILNNWKVITGMLLIPFIVGLLSGIYPALFMSSFQPVRVLKGLFRVGGANISFRKILVTTQFAISIILIICTIVVFSQMRYMQQKQLGFDRDHVINLPYVSAISENYDAFRSELLTNSYIKNAGRSSRIPTGRLLDAMGAQIKKGDTLAPADAGIKFVSADQDFLPTYGVKMVAGRGFSRDFSTDTSSFLINEAAANVLGMTNEEAIGKDFGYGNRRGRLIGVFNDFHFESLHEKIVPLVILVPRNTNNYGNISIKVTGTNIPAALTHIERTWKKFLPEVPYQYTFLDENFNRLYDAEEKQKTIFTIFACIAIFIACLGLFGLSAFAISQRIKEIGIRKVLGASVNTIVSLLSKDFLKLVLLAALIAFPIAWYAMNNWLEDFAYRIAIPWWAFIVAGILAALIALFTISFQAIKAAVRNPVKSLRTE